MELKKIFFFIWYTNGTFSCIHENTEFMAMTKNLLWTSGDAITQICFSVCICICDVGSGWLVTFCGALVGGTRLTSGTVQLGHSRAQQHKYIGHNRAHTRRCVGHIGSIGHTLVPR